MSDIERAVAILRAEIQACLAAEQSDAAHYRSQGMRAHEAAERAQASYAPFHLLKCVKAIEALAMTPEASPERAG